MSKPAILGGKPILQTRPEFLRWPTGGDLEKEALVRTLRSGVWGTLGAENAAFSRRYADYCGVKHALAVLNGTVSLELIFRALGIGYGDEVIVPPYTFTASVHAIVMAGAMPVFADIDPNTYTICPESVKSKITGRTRAILGVHLGGRPFDADALGKIASEHGLYLIEDAAHAHGSEWRGRRAGSLGVAGSFSFQASKNISCGEGGAITTNDTALYERLWGMHHNGRAFGDGGYNHPLLGTDARLAEWQCAVLCARMERIDRDIELRMHNAHRLDEALGKLPYIEVMAQDPRITRNALHLYVFKYKAQALGGLSRDMFIRAVEAENVCMPATGYCDPIYDMEMLYTDDFNRMTGRKFENPKATLPNNERAAHEEGCWLYHSSLLGTDADTDRIVEAFERVAAAAGQLRAMDAGRE